MIDLKALDEVEIAAQELDMSQLWMVRLHDEVFGPFATDTLKAYAQENPALMADADVTTMAEENWVLYLQSPLRPVKKKEPPKLVAATTLQTHNSYHLEKHGQRQGPFTHESVSEMVKKGELIPTDLISDDEGLTWHKLYQLKEFETRPHAAGQLPFAPLEEAFSRSHDDGLVALTEEENPVREGLVSFANYAHRKAGTALKLEELALPKEYSSEPTIKAPTKAWWIGGGATATAALALMIYWAQAPAPLEIEVVAEDSVIEEMDPGTTLLESSKQRQPRRLRAPASVPQQRIDSPPAMTDTRRDLREYRQMHNDPRDDYQERNEPMDADPYAADSQMAQNDGLVRQPAEAPDDGYRMEEPIPGETGPIVEEVGDF